MIASILKLLQLSEDCGKGSFHYYVRHNTTKSNTTTTINTTTTTSSSQNILIEFPLIPKEDKLIRLINYLLVFRYDLILKNQLSKQNICGRKFMNMSSNNNAIKGNKRSYSSMNKSSTNKIHKKSKENKGYLYIVYI